MIEEERPPSCCLTTQASVLADHCAFGRRNGNEVCVYGFGCGGINEIDARESRGDLNVEKRCEVDLYPWVFFGEFQGSLCLSGTYEPSVPFSRIIEKHSRI